MSSCNFNTCVRTNVSGCSYDSACAGYCLLSTCGGSCAAYNTGGCSSCSVGCYSVCSTASCITTCSGLATSYFLYYT